MNEEKSIMQLLEEIKERTEYLKKLCADIPRIEDMVEKITRVNVYNEVPPMGTFNKEYNA